ncbi:MAG: transcription-repair coupling factor [Phycisphaerales bacterium]|nr:transcription-repair coupling factor [Phycisphaerales bacterium]
MPPMPLMPHMDWFPRIRDSTSVDAIVKLLHENKGKLPISVTGSAGSSASVITSAIASRMAAPVVLVMAHRDEADEAAAEIRGIVGALGAECGVDCALFPALESSFAAHEVAEQCAERMRVLRRIDAGDSPRIIVAPVTALMQGVPSAAEMPSMLMTISQGERHSRESLLLWLSQGGYERMATAESPGSFAVRGGIMDIFAVDAIAPIRIELQGDEVERIFEVDPGTQATDRRIESIDLIRGGGLFDADRVEPLSDRLDPRTILVLQDSAEILEQSRGYQDRLADGRGIVPWKDTLRALHLRCATTIECGSLVQVADAARHVSMHIKALDPFPPTPAAAVANVFERARTHAVCLLCETAGDFSRASELCAQHAPDPQHAARIHIEQRRLQRGFTFEEGPNTKIALVPWHELLNRFGVRRRGGAQAPSGSGRSRDAFLFFEPGDYVVHRDHGVALYHGLKPLPQQERTSSSDDEYLTLEFHGGALLHVPASKVSLVQRYIGAGAQRPHLSALGGKRWSKQKEDVAEAVRDLAGELIRVHAVRESTAGIAFPADSPWQREFEAEFPFVETEDQVTAIAATKRDMERARPMDRLVCGDVGFGKTEIALRAAFKCADSGRQVAVLVPTTVLADQHERVFRQRLRAYPFVVEGVSRFKSDREVREILDRVAAGTVDIVIGTHRLLSADVRFHDLGMVVIDEEQRFGVEHKQRLFEFRLTADVLTLSATPIPRTLHMAMLGLRDISSLTTPPPDRRAIVTEVMPWSPDRLAGAIRRELAREGQVFWVHNRVYDIESAADDVRRLAPDARIVVGHGQMGEGELEEVMRKFMHREADILVSTTIIESGIDIATANTMIIDNAHRFGLSELHQLRGRVGRSNHRAYCYLLLPTDRPVPADAMKRLRALEDYSMLGAGFRIAVRDLEIRGAGNLLGSEQSGHIAAVGYELYCKMLDQSVRDLRCEPQIVPIDTVIDIGLTGLLSKSYIPSDRRRLEAYRRLSDATTPEQLAKAIGDLVNGYGDLPDVTADLCLLSEIRLRSTMMGVRSLRRAEGDLVFRTPDPQAIHAMFRGSKGSVRTVGDRDEKGIVDVYWRPPQDLRTARAIAQELQKRLTRATTLQSRSN